MNSIGQNPGLTYVGKCLLAHGGAGSDFVAPGGPNSYNHTPKGAVGLGMNPARSLVYHPLL